MLRGYEADLPKLPTVDGVAEDVFRFRFPFVPEAEPRVDRRNFFARSAARRSRELTELGSS